MIARIYGYSCTKRMHAVPLTWQRERERMEIVKLWIHVLFYIGVGARHCLGDSCWELSMMFVNLSFPVQRAERNSSFVLTRHDLKEIKSSLSLVKNMIRLTNEVFSSSLLVWYANVMLCLCSAAYYILTERPDLLRKVNHVLFSGFLAFNLLMITCSAQEVATQVPPVRILHLEIRLFAQWSYPSRAHVFLAGVILQGLYLLDSEQDEHVPINSAVE